MKTMMEQLYKSFYIESKFNPEKIQIERNEQQLKQDLTEEQKKILLRIIDGYDLMIENVSFESFVQGFRVGCKLINEMNRIDGLL